MYTLTNFLSMQTFEEFKREGKIKVLTPQINLSEVNFNYISVIEPPVENFVRKKELVLSTALGCINDDAKFFEFVKEIYDCHPAALVLCFKPENKPVPKCVVNFANENNFPIIRIPWECRFAELIELTLNGINSDQNTCKAEYDMLQKKLLNLFLTEQPLESAAHLISDSFSSSVHIYDRYHKVKASFLLDENKTEIQYLGEIKVNGYLYGFIELFDCKNTRSLQIDQNLLESYLSITLSLWFNKEDVINLTGLRIKNDYILKLATCNECDMDKLILDGQSLGFNLNSQYVGIVFQAYPKNQLIKHNLFSKTISFNMSAIENLILAEAKLENINILITLKDKTFLMYVEINNIARINSFLDKLETILLNNYPEYQLYWGIGEIPPKPLDFSQQYKKAILALEQCIASKTPVHRMTYKESRITSLVFQTADNNHLKELAYQTLGKIIENDRTNALGMNLMQTLTTFIKCNYNVSLTARKLHLHRQSLLYRIEKIEQLTNCSLSNHDDLFLLEFYCRLFMKM